MRPSGFRPTVVLSCCLSLAAFLPAAVAGSTLRDLGSIPVRRPITVEVGKIGTHAGKTLLIRCASRSGNDALYAVHRVGSHLHRLHQVRPRRFTARQLRTGTTGRAAAFGTRRPGATVAGLAFGANSPFRPHLGLDEAHGSGRSLFGPFRLTDLDGDGGLELLRAPPGTGRLMLAWTPRRRGPEIGSPATSRLTIDSRAGTVATLLMGDLNADGQIDLATISLGKGRTVVRVYEVPDCFRTDPWPRHEIAHAAAARVPKSASPPRTRLVAFHPRSPAFGKKPWLLLTGGGIEEAVLLRPLSTRSRDWRYGLIPLEDTRLARGRGAASDVDGDGTTEIFVPDEDKNRVRVFTFSPSPRGRRHRRR